MAKVTEEVFVLVPVKQAYRAFTNSTSLREWLCDMATIEAHPNGRMYLWWRGDFYSSGHYLELDENKRVRFRWLSNTDSAPTEVTVSVSEKEGPQRLLSRQREAVKQTHRGSLRVHCLSSYSPS